MDYPYYEVIWDMKLKSFGTLEEAIEYARDRTHNNVENYQALIVAKKDAVTINSIFGFEWDHEGVFVMSNLVI